MSRRKRSRGHKLPPGKFVAIPADTLKQSLAILTAGEFRVFICLCAQSQPWSNGTAYLTKSVIREYRLGSTRTVTAATAKLIEAELIRRTRRARQHVAARYGVTHLPLNLDAMAKQGFSGTTSEALDDESSDSHSGSAAARPHRKRYRDHIGSAEPLNGSSAEPHRKRKPPFSTISAEPQGKRSKTLPSPTADSTATEGVLQ